MYGTVCTVRYGRYGMYGTVWKVRYVRYGMNGTYGTRYIRYVKIRGPDPTFTPDP